MSTALAIFPVSAPTLAGLKRMVDPVKKSLLSAFRSLMRPLIRILLRHGVAFREFADAIKTVYVDVCEQDFKLQGKKQTLSRIAIITGLTRKEVARIAEIIKTGEHGMTSNVDRVSNVLRGWYQDPDFNGPYGIPRDLSFDKEHANFTELVRRYSGDMPARAMLEEVLRVGAVEELPGPFYKVLSRSYIPLKVDPSIMEFMGEALRDLAETLDYNLNPDTKNPLLERRVWTPTGIDLTKASSFDETVRDHGEQFIDRIENWFDRNQLDESEASKMPPEEIAKVGVGIYMFADKNKERISVRSVKDLGNIDYENID